MPSAKIHHLTAPAKKAGRPPSKPPKPPKIRRDLYSFDPLLAQPAPARMEPEAAEIFTKLTAELSKTGAHAEADLLIIEQLVDAIISYREIRALLKSDGSVIVNEKGAKLTHPGLFVLNAERQTILSLAAMLMLSPRSRGGHLSKSIFEMMDEPPAEEIEEKEEPAEEPPAKIASGDF